MSKYTLDQMEGMPTDELYQALRLALSYGHFGQAYMLADELCRPDKAVLGKELMMPAHKWSGMMGIPKDQLQGLEDRIEQYNSYSSYAHPDPCGNSECETCLSAGADPMAQD